MYTGYSNYYYGCNQCHSTPCRCTIEQQRNCTTFCEGCPTQLKDICVFYTGNNLSCVGITTGNTLNQIVKAIDSKICSIIPPSGDCCLTTVKISLTKNQILNIYDTPIQLVPAPGVGKFIQPFTITSNFKFVNTEYTINNVLRAYCGNVTDNAIAGFVISGTQNIFQTQTASNATINTNTALMISQQNGNPGDGDGTLDLYITYKIITL